LQEGDQMAPEAADLMQPETRRTRIGEMIGLLKAGRKRR
jgi:hypothetical protein